MDLHALFLSKLAPEDEISVVGLEEELRKRINTSLNAFAKRNSINSGSLSAMLKGKRAIPLSLVGREMITEHTRWLLKGANVPLIMPKTITNDLGYLLGVLRDGTVSTESPGEWTVAFYGMNKEHIQKIQQIVYTLFGIERPLENFGAVFGVRVRSKTLYQFFTLLFDAKPKQKDWNTPKLIAQAARDVKLSYIAGFFDAEGGIPHLEHMKEPKRKHLYVKFVQKNKESLEFIKATLESEGVSMGKVYYSDKKYVVKVSLRSVPLFSQLITPLHPKKAARLRMLTRLLVAL